MATIVTCYDSRDVHARWARARPRDGCRAVASGPGAHAGAHVRVHARRAGGRLLDRQPRARSPTPATCSPTPARSALALFATWIAARPPTPAKTYGYYRAEILAALVNALLLLVVAGAILVEAWRRWQRAGARAGRADGDRGRRRARREPGLRVAAAPRRRRQPQRAGRLPGGASATRSARWPRWSPPASCCCTGWTGADPLAGVAIALLIVPRTWSLLKQAVNVLLEGTPPHLELGRDRGGDVRGAPACGASTTCTCGR